MQLCGGSSSNYNNSICIDENYICPLTSIQFSETEYDNGTTYLEVSDADDSTSYLGLVALKLSEDTPCVFYDEYSN